MRTLRVVAALVMAAGIQPLVANAASAAPPANDEYAGAVALHLGDVVEQDTTEATTTADDAALNASCGAPWTKASVWYTYTPEADTRAVLDMQSSDYSGGFLVFDGPPSSDTFLGCNAEQYGLRAYTGHTYYVMVFSDTNVNGGQLVLSLRKAPPPPRVDVTLARRGLAYRGGAARVHGTYRCIHGDYTYLYGDLHQRAGRLKIPGYFEKERACDGVRRTWSARVVSETGTYAPGAARAHVGIESCGIFRCAYDDASHRVRLVRAGSGAGARALAPETTGQGRPRPLVERQQHWPGS